MVLTNCVYRDGEIDVWLNEPKTNMSNHTHTKGLSKTVSGKKSYSPRKCYKQHNKTRKTVIKR